LAMDGHCLRTAPCVHPILISTRDMISTETGS
jgi:hypothetical protein